MRNKNIYASAFRKFIFAILLSLPLFVFASEEPQETVLKGANIIQSAIVTTSDPVFGTAGWSSQTAYDVKNIVQFEIDFDNVANKYFHNQTFTATINVNIDCYGNPLSPGTITNTYSNVALQVNYNPAVGSTYKGIANYKFNGAYKVVVTVNSPISATGINIANYPIFKLTNKLIVTRQYNFNDIPTGGMKYTTDGKKLSVQWVPTNFAGAELFDVEWTYVDRLSSMGAYLANTTPFPPANVPVTLLEPNFRNNSGRVTLSGSSYQFNLNYDQGFLLFRIRGVQYRYTDGIRMEGNWTYSAQPLGGSLYNYFTCGVVRIDWHEQDLNWQYNAVFAEDGKKKEIISYYDGSLRSRQTVTLNNEDNVSVVAEPIYDALGRPSMSILPAPVTDNVLKYYRLFNVNNNLKPASYKDIPTASCGIIASPLSPTSGVEKYYSANNPFMNDPAKPWNQAIPQSEGFPFSVTQYTPDNTGRIRSQGGVGKDFQLGTDHETKYFYGKPSQYELDRLFGADVGEHTHYLKNMVVDANGQVSVSYLNSEGKTIATALAGIPPANLEALGTATPPTSTVHDVLLTPSSFQINNSRSSLEATSTFLVSSTGNYKFTYRFTPQQYAENYSGGTLCYTCSYDLLITIKDECGNELKREEIYKITPFDINCGPQSEISNLLDVDIYKVGEYTAYFELRVNGETLDEYTDHYLTNNTDIKKLNYFLLEQLIQEDLSECYSDCDACKSLPETVAEFIDKIKAYYIREGLPFDAPEATYAENLYNTIKDNCVSISAQCIVSPCDEILDILKSDVSPGGQYAEFDNDYNLVDPEINVLTHYTQVSYLDEDGNPAQVEDANGNMVAPSALPLKDFIQNFEESWATSLAPFHPEYCYYTWCTMNDQSQLFNQQLEDQNDAMEAIDQGLFVRGNSLTLLQADPFFNGGYGSGYYSEMKDDLNLYSQNVLHIANQSNKDILSCIDFLLYCGNADPVITWDNCYKDPNDPCRSAYKEWLLYKNWYLDLKLKYYTKAMKEVLPGCTNCFIPSSGDFDPVGFGNCVAPPLSSFSVEVVPNSSADGLKRILIKYLGGNEISQWPLDVQVHMHSTTNGLDVTQSLIFAPGFGSQEMTVQEEFDQFNITAVSCAQILAERHMGGFNGKGARKSRAPIGKVNKSNASSVILGLLKPTDNAVSGKIVKQRTTDNAMIMPIDWPCPSGDDFEVGGVGSSTMHICYNGVAVPPNHSATVFYDVELSCPGGSVIRRVQFDFCNDEPVCKQKEFEIGCEVKSIRFISVQCDNAPCVIGWECPEDKSYYNITYAQVPNSSNWELKVCYTGATIPAGKMVIVTVYVTTGCGSILETFKFCGDGVVCKSRIYSKAEVCGSIRGASLENAKCVDEACVWECPKDKSNYTITYNQIPNSSDWELKICYTGSPIPAGKTVYVLLDISTGCGSISETFKFCADGIICKTKVYSTHDVCDIIRQVSVKDVGCKDEICLWECPVDVNNYLVTFSQVTGSSDWQVKVCYNGSPIPTGKTVYVDVYITSGCTSFIETFKFCSGGVVCKTKIYSAQVVCDKISDAKVRSANCKDEICVWECPKEPNNFSITYYQVPGSTNWELKVCYTGDPVPSGKVVYVDVYVSSFCNSFIQTFKFCADGISCKTKIFSAQDVCDRIKSAIVRDVNCKDETCAWECPTDPGNYTITYNQLPGATNWQVKVCYTGSPIPAGKTVFVNVMIQTGCGNTMEVFKFCGDGVVCKVRTFTSQQVCTKISSASVRSVECYDEPCSWECPTDISNYSITVTTIPNSIYKELKICYTGPAIPAGKVVIVNVDINWNCNTTTTEQIRFCSTSPLCITRLVTYHDCTVLSATVRNVECADEECSWECPTDPSNYSVNYYTLPNGDWEIKTCYLGAPIPAGKTVVVEVSFKTDCGVTRTFSLNFCSENPLCQSRRFTSQDVCRRITDAGISRVECFDRVCEWECPVDNSNYIISKILNPLSQNWEVKVCYTGPAIPFNKTVIVPVYINSNCNGQSISYEIRLCQGISCNTYIVDPVLACEGRFDVKLGDVVCIDAPCSAPCPGTEEFTAVVNTSVACTPLPNYTARNIRVSHVGGPLYLQLPLARVKVKLEITTVRPFPLSTRIDYKNVWFNNGDIVKDVCFNYLPGYIITLIKVLETECKGPCPPGDCCDDPRYGLYDGKTRRFQDYIEPDFAAVMQSYNNGTTNFSAYPLTFCKNECEMIADSWIQDLNQCTSDPVRLERVRRALIDVCKQSCQAQQGNPTIHPYSDVNPAPSFESVIIAEFGSLTANCAYDLISDPYPWGKIPKAENTFATETNSQICAKLQDLQNEASSKGYATDVDGVHDYLSAYYMLYYTLEKAELTDLFTGCFQCNGIMPLPVEMPPFMDGDAKPCLTCDAYDALVQAFNAKYPGVTSAHPKYEILFRNFANHQTGFSHAYANYYDFQEKCTLNANNFRDTGHICETPLTMEMEVDLVAQCMEEKFYNALANATVIYTAYIDSVKRAFRNNYTAHCLSAQPWLETDAKLYEYHYTLYYFDESGNLVKTIPPAGVEYLSDAQITSLQANRAQFIAPLHRLATIYRYNSFNQVVWQSTPDAGVSEFWYDRLGRLTVSQNSEQRNPVNGGLANRYSYTKYEAAMDRIIEVGEKSGVPSITSIDTRDDASLQNWLSSGTDIQITQTIYDRADIATVTNSLITSEQQNSTSRKRIVSTIFRKMRYPSISQYDAATHYSYDVNGNAKIVWQENEQLKQADPSTQGLKRMDYDFDLISGKVNKVVYQKNKGDQFTYKYSYDAENRMTGALSSRDGLLWQNDATYRYYLHGPLARTELGSLKVQGIDMAYTLQGLLKFINAPVINETADISHDGDNTFVNNIFKRVSRDAFAYGISYFDGEYKPIKPLSPLMFSENINSTITSDNLFNGNIRATTLQIAQLGTPKTYSYKYDQLNRISKMRKHETNYVPVAGSTGATLNIANFTDEYLENISYDANGNIQTYFRNGKAPTLGMDELNYHYIPNSNKLSYVSDLPSLSSNYIEDIDDQASGNYTYDAVGNLIKDNSEKIGNIVWNVYGKITKITKTDINNTIIEYEYNASGKRIFKKVTSGGNTNYTYYILDAQGNNIANYTKAGVSAVLWSEQYLFGSQRLGIVNLGISVPAATANPAPGMTLSDGFDYGKVMYELNNHLSNVLATVNDKKNAVELSGTGTVDFFTAEVMTANDYYPFGMTMPGRKYNSTSSSYRYGFQNQELDNELWGGAISFSHRVEDPRLGRFFSVDPLTGKYPYYTPYSFSGNQVIAFVELEGLEQLYYHLKFDANTGEAKLKYVGQTDRWFLPDLHKVYLEDYPGVAFTFSNNPFAGANNYYIDFEEFKKDPIAGINKFKSDGQILSETVQEVILAILLRRATKTNKPYQPKRLQQDVALGKNKKAPAALNTQGRTIGKNTNQNKAVQDRVAELKKKGATDIRVDQQQVDADGNHVGVNRPDLQYTLDGKRHYVEWDTPSSNRGPGHEARIKANDPKAGTVELITLE